jgi:hypothetical protein
VAYNVVCISATDGANGEDVGPLVADALGFRLVNEQIVARAADEAGIQAHVMADVEVRRSVVDRVIHELLSAKAAGAPRGVAAPAAAGPAPSLESLRGLIRSVIEDIASRGDAVIVSHAASHALGDRPDTLRVLITAGPDARRDRIKAARSVSDKEADKHIARGDANRADYIKRFYDVSAELPTHYDIVLNTDRLSTDQAVAIIVRATSADAASAPAAEAT